MKKYYLLPTLFFFACAGAEETEDSAEEIAVPVVEVPCSTEKASEAVLEKFGGEVTVYEGEVDADGVNKKALFVDIDGSDVTAEFSEMLQIPTSLAAYTLYQNLDDNCSNIQIFNTRLMNGEEIVYGNAYELNILNLIAEVEPIYHQFSSNIKDKNVDAINDMFVEEFQGDPLRQNLNQNLPMAEQHYGEIISSELQGFRVIDDTIRNTEQIHLTGIMERKKQNTAYSLYLERESRKVVGYSYSY